MAAFKNFFSSFRGAARVLPAPALIVERPVLHPRNNRFMTMERVYAEIKYILTVGVALAGAAVVVNQELTNSKFEGVSTKIEGVSTRIEGVSIEVARLGQRVDRMEQKFENMEKRMDEKFARMEKKIDELLIQQSVPNFWPWSQWRR